jgi:hypothetical protein
MPQGQVLGFVEGFFGGAGLGHEGLGAIADPLWQLMAALQVVEGLLDAFFGVQGALVVDAGGGGQVDAGVAFGFCALGPVVVLHSFAPGGDAGGDVVLMAAVLLITGELLGGL